jgi:hypothetical protein
MSGYPVRLAARTRLLTLAVCTTGATDLSATAAGYARAVGSFLTDGFAPGMQVTPSGFTQTDTGVVSAVTATLLTIAGGRTVQAVGAGRTVACLLPASRAWENVDYTPTTGVPWVEEQYTPGPVQQIGAHSQGDVYAWPMYFVTFYAPSNMGVGALDGYAGAALALFPPGQPLALTGGDGLVVRRNPAPYAGQIMFPMAGWAAVQVTLPLWLQTHNSI